MDIHIQFINQWLQVFGKWNWYNWDVIHIGTEWDMEVTGGYELILIVLGIGVVIRHNVNFEESAVGKKLPVGKACLPVGRVCNICDETPREGYLCSCYGGGKDRREEV